MDVVTPQTMMERAKEALDAIRRKGGQVPQDFQAALEEYEALSEEQRTAESDSYRRLESEIEQSREAGMEQASPPADVLPDKLKVNWPGSLTNILMVCISIVIMIVVAQLSMFYEEGKSLLVDIRAFQSQRMERRISQLERQLIYARTDAVASVAEVGSAKPTVDEASFGDRESTGALAQERYYDIFFDLRDADRVVSSLLRRSTGFWDAASNPAPILTPIVVPIQRLLGRSYEDEYASVVAKLPTSPPHLPLSRCDSYKETLERLSNAKGTMWLQLISDGQKACLFYEDNRMDNFALALPSMQEHINLIESRLKPYSVWILPVSFAIFGAVMFYMRLILNEHLPTPSLLRVLHRIALSAVAAVVLSLFWSSLVSPNSEFEAVGFTVFTLAFVIGFSIDIFFSYLDRTVAVAVGVIKKDETQSEKGQALAAAANG